MKIKYHILLVLFLTYVNVAFAWQSGYTKEQFSEKEEGKTEFNPHWFLSLQGGGAYTLGEAIFGDLVSPSVAVDISLLRCLQFGQKQVAGRLKEVG